MIRRMLVRAGNCTTSCLLASFLFAASAGGFVPFQSTISRFYGVGSPPRYNFSPRDNREHITTATSQNGDPRFNFYHSWARWASENDDDDPLEPVDQESINNATMNETWSTIPPDESPKSSFWRRWNPFRRKAKEPGPEMKQELPQANNHNKTITTTTSSSSSSSSTNTNQSSVLSSNTSQSSVLSSNTNQSSIPSSTHSEPKPEVEPLQGDLPEKKRRRSIRPKKLIAVAAQLLGVVAALLLVSPAVTGEFTAFWRGQMASDEGHSPRRTMTMPQLDLDGDSGGDVTTTTTTFPDAEEEDEVLAELEASVLVEKDEQEPPQDATDLSMEKKSKPKVPSRNNIEKQQPSFEKRRTMSLSFVTDAVEKIGPAVVRIDTETLLLDSEQQPGEIPPLATGFVQQGQGSGLIFSKDGLVLTNAHVVEDATKVSVTLTDGRIYEAEVLGSDEIVDIAVLRILPEEDDENVGGGKASSKSALSLPVAELGNSDELRVGQIVVAVGSPGGLDNTVTMGIISGLERSSTMVGIPHKKVDYIQCDAAINPGNSGGPLVEVDGARVVGINAAIRAHMEGTSFAIPINRVQEIMYDLAEGKEIQHGYLGISLATCTPEWARKNNIATSKLAGEASRIRIPEIHGALVHKVFPRTPAEKGGLHAYDIVIHVNGRKVHSSDDARRQIDGAPVGVDLTLTVLRGKQQLDITVQPVDLATRLKEIRRERQHQHRERLRSQEHGPFRLFK